MKTIFSKLVHTSLVRQYTRDEDEEFHMRHLTPSLLDLPDLRPSTARDSGPELDGSSVPRSSHTFLCAAVAFAGSSWPSVPSRGKGN